MHISFSIIIHFHLQVKPSRADLQLTFDPSTSLICTTSVFTAPALPPLSLSAEHMKSCLTSFDLSHLASSRLVFCQAGGSFVAPTMFHVGEGKHLKNLFIEHLHMASHSIDIFLNKHSCGDPQVKSSLTQRYRKQTIAPQFIHPVLFCSSFMFKKHVVNVPLKKEG